MGAAQFIHFASDDLLAAAVAENWLAAIGQAQSEGRKYLVALSGGRVTKKMFAAAVPLANERRMSFQGVEFFWADERCVPPDDPESNYLIADQLLLKPAQIPPQSVHRIKGEIDPASAAQLAAAELSLFADKKFNSIPVFDLILLGMGEDGHVASLFPGDLMAARDHESIFLPIANSPKPPPRRVTLGHGPIAFARDVWVLASGRGKEIALRESLLADGRTPLGQVIQGRETTKIFSDIHPA